MEIEYGMSENMEGMMKEEGNSEERNSKKSQLLMTQGTQSKTMQDKARGIWWEQVQRNLDTRLRNYNFPSAV